MSDFETVAQAEDRSFALAELHELVEERDAPVFDGTRWAFPVASKGEEQ